MAIEGPGIETYEWTAEAGDWLLLGTDGFIDAGLAVWEIGSFLAEAESAEDVVNTLCTKILKRMNWNRAKPDNLTLIAVRRIHAKNPV